MKKPQTTTRRNGTIRCAIYTRKSSEEGLEQEFNSLQAQHEACEAFINSQRHEGWVCLRAAYDDGGFSGATMDRPALQHQTAGRIGQDGLSPAKARLRWDRRGIRQPHQRHCGTGIWPDRDIAAGWRDIDTPYASLPTWSRSQPRTPARKAGVPDFPKPDAGERRTLRWREMDSNIQSRVRERFSRLAHLSSPDNARETPASNFDASTARYS